MALVLAVIGCVPGRAAELDLNFAKDAIDAAPVGFTNKLVGVGRPGDWRVLMDAVPPSLAPFTPGAPTVSKQAVLAQLSRDPTDERFPLLVYEGDVFRDFKLTVNVKTVGGALEQMAGVAFRLQDEKNFYALRISSLGNTFRFYRVANGVRDPPVGPVMDIAKGVWHEISVECQGNLIRLKLDGKQVIPDITDNAFSEGKIGFWTKSDSVSYFSNIRIVYTPREFLAQALVREMIQKYPRLLGLKVFAPTTHRADLRLVASDTPSAPPEAAGKVEQDCIAKNAVFFGRLDHRVLVTLPLHDRNGDPMAAVRVVMRSFPGQTDRNAIARATPIIRHMEERVHSLADLTE